MRTALIFGFCFFFSTVAAAEEMKRGCFPDLEAYKRLESVGAASVFLGLGGESKTPMELWRGVNQSWALTARRGKEICIIDFGSRSVFKPEGLPADGFREIEEEKR